MDNRAPVCTFRLRDDLHQEMMELARENERTFSGEIRYAIIKHLEFAAEERSQSGR